jgi:TatD DNase family protein
LPVFTDTHCHLNYHTFNTDLEDVIHRAQDVQVKRILVPGTDMDSSRVAVSLAERFPIIYAAVGIHPNEAQKWIPSNVSELAILAAHPKVVAIGEIGLDYYREKAPISLQKDVFIAQLEIAEKLHLPVIVHSRQAFPEVWKILELWHNQLKQSSSSISHRPGVLHSFEGDFNMAETPSQRNFFIGIGGPVTYKNALKKHDLAAHLSNNNILVETDAPFLSPIPHRGKRNEPAYIPVIIAQIAHLRNVTTDLLASLTTRNSEILFGWGNVS